MSGIAEAGVNKIIDVVDVASKSAVEAVQELSDAAADTAKSGIDAVDAVKDIGLAEVEEARVRFFTLLRSLATKIVEPLP